MPDVPQTSKQMEELTTSQNGTNRVSRLKPESHFYIKGGNQVGDFKQTPNQAFGVTSPTKFRTTATVTFTGSKDIYAICMGTAFLQPGGSNKVNLILRPFKQPVKGLNIKYIIYRGLKKTDFITSAGKVAGNETNGSGFVQYLWEQFNKFYKVADGETAPDFKAGFIGFPHTANELALQKEEHLIDQYFFKKAKFTESATPEEEPETAFELPVIPRGLHLGKATAKIGIDIVLNDGDYIIENDNHPFKLNLAYARAATYTINTNTETNDFRKKLLRETATKFIDIAAFYGLHANGAGKLYVDDMEKPLINKADIASRLQNFNTKNNFYLYIQANRQRSYNFYDNYTHSETNTNTIKIGTAEDSLTETTYGTKGWPVHIINEEQEAATPNNTITFQLTTDNYDGAALFTQIGELTTPHEENFVRNTNLLQQPPEDDTVEVDFNYTQAIQISTPAIGKNTIASFSQCIYEGRLVEVTDNADPEQVYFLKDIDDVFGLINAKSIFSIEEDQLPIIVDETIQIVNFSNSETGDDIGVVKHQRIEDKIETINSDTFLDRVTYESIILNINIKDSPVPNKSTANIDSINGGINQSRFYKPKLPYVLDRQLFNHSNSTITGIKLITQNGDISTKKILGLTKEENQRLIDVVVANNLINTQIFFKNELDLEEETYSSVEDIEYRVYQLGIIAENSSGKLHFYKVTDKIIIYTIDNFIYVSSDYSNYIPFISKENFANTQIPEL